MIIRRGTVGVDAGASLWKLVYQSDELHTSVLCTGQVAELRDQLEAWQPQRVYLTGGAAASLERDLAGSPVRTVPEFEAWARGAPLLAECAGHALPESFLLVSLGTGTSILAVVEGVGARVAGTALGGGTLLGLGRLLLGESSFDEIVALAGRGDRRKVDLLVGDIYRDGGTPLPPELNASSFAKLDSREPADLAHAILGVVGENVSIICTIAARSASITTVVYGGSTVARNPALVEILRNTTGLLGREPLFLEQGAFCGAVGAAAGAAEEP
jgi:type II pantothenate kinase